jgi:hypothetical protein
MTEEARPGMSDPNFVAQTPAVPEDSVLARATPASAVPPVHRHRRHSSRRAKRKRRQRQIVVGVIFLAVVAIGAILLLPDNSSKTSTTKAAAAATTTTALTTPDAAGTIRWTHADLEGKVVTVVPGKGSMRFVVVEGKYIPAVVAGFDSTLARKGCAGAGIVYQKQAAARPAQPASAARQSAYTAYELEQGKAKNCSWAESSS